MENQSDKERICEALDEIAEVIEKTAAGAGRNPKEIRLMAVTKTVEPRLVNYALEWGVSLLGENRAQELCAKYNDYALKPGDEIHFIGTLQTNKVRQIIDKVTCIESLDNLRLAAEIEKQCISRQKRMDVLIEVNIGNESSKSGVAPADLESFILSLLPYSHLNLRGLMAIPPICDTTAETERYFEQVQKLFIDIKAKKLDNISNFDIISMGMSGDYAQAIRYGSNIIRIGTAIFGKRH